ncbi:ankyrin repeat-containing domain protein [Baffinella frigidus]|nr:ankyrin repeat-containing domain protein [Cryptophyta sp. CCMP2293]
MAKAGDQYEHRTGNIWNYSERDDVEAVRRLVEEGVSPVLVNKVGWTPLHAAAHGGGLRVLGFLLKLKKPSCERDPLCRAGRTPLMDAARKGHLEAAKVLVAAGASLEARDGAGIGMIEYAKGTPMRLWLEQRLLKGSTIPKTEKRAERQPIGASSKQKAAALKAKKAKKAADRENTASECAEPQSRPGEDATVPAADELGEPAVALATSDFACLRTD